MAVPVDHFEARKGIEDPVTVPLSCTINISDIRTLKVSNISLSATEQDIREFFSFSGDIHYVEMQRESEMSQLAYVTFKQSQGADTAMLLSGATIVDRSVSISPAENYQLPPSAHSEKERVSSTAYDSTVVKKAEDMVSSMLAKGYLIGKDAMSKAKAFDERHKVISNASATVSSLDQKIGLSEKLYMGTTIVNDKVREVDEKYQVFEKTKSAFSAVEEKASAAGSALFSNRFVSTGVSWVSNALGMVAKTAEDVTTLTKEKVGRAEEEKKETLDRTRTGASSDLAHVHVEAGPPLVATSGEPAVLPINSKEDDGQRTI